MLISSDILDMILNAGPIVKLVMLILLFFSIFSWAIILHKFITLKKVYRESRVFLSFFREHTNLILCYEAAKRYDSPFSRIFTHIYEEARKTTNPRGNLVGSSSDMKRLEIAVRRARNENIRRIERFLPFLATTGNTTPFIGLFGTVWGIMASFRGLGTRGSANLAVVGPGISEALIATAMGLFAAIPAVIGYNYFLHKTNTLAAEMEEFSEEVLTLMTTQPIHRDEPKVSVK